MSSSSAQVSVMETILIVVTWRWMTRRMAVSPGNINFIKTALEKVDISCQTGEWGVKSILVNSPMLAVETFGDLLKFLRRKARLTQRELAIAVGYTEAHICRLEKNERLPDLATVAALFVPALYIDDEPEWAERLLKLAAETRREPGLVSVNITQVTVEHLVEQELGALEDIPEPPAQNVPRPALIRRIGAALRQERGVALVGLPGAGKTALAASVARQTSAGPVFWHTLVQGVNTSAEAIARQLALFLLANGQAQARPLLERRGDGTLLGIDQQLLLLRAALAARPALLCFDDAHLLLDDEPALGLLRSLLTTTNARLLLTSRQDLPLPLAQLDLGGLEPEEGRALAAQLGLDLNEAVLEHLLERTAGSPMLLRLAAGQLLEAQSDSQAFVDGLESRPQVAAYLLNTVLHGLEPASRWLAGLVSVFRQPLDLYDAALNELIEAANPPGCMETALDDLRRRRLVDDPQRAALHPLLRDHLYATLGVNARRRKQLHRLAARWSEQAGEIVEAAFHWTRAGDLEQAAEVIGDQGDWLFDRGQARAAFQVVDEALQLAGRLEATQPPEKLRGLRRRLLTARGDFLRGTLRSAEAEASYRAALDLAQGQPAVRGRIAVNLVYLLLMRGRSAEALALYQDVAAQLAEGDLVLRARLAAAACRAYMAFSRYDDAWRSAQEALVLAERFAGTAPQVASDVRARAERTLGWISYTRHPEGAESLAHYRRALQHARLAGLRVVENAVLSNTATALAERGELEAAQRTYQEALQGAQALGDVYAAGGILHNLGMLQHQREEYPAALESFGQAVEIERLVGDYEGLLSTEAARAATLLTMNRVDEARRLLETALAESPESTDAWTLGTFLCVLAEVLLLQDQLEPARRNLERVLAIEGVQENARIYAWAQSDLALVMLLAGELEPAQNILAAPPADDLGAELTIRWKLAQCAVALAAGDQASARSQAQALLASPLPASAGRLLRPARRLLADPPPTLAEYTHLVLT